MMINNTITIGSLFTKYPTSVIINRTICNILKICLDNLFMIFRSLSSSSFFISNVNRFGSETSRDIFNSNAYEVARVDKDGSSFSSTNTENS